MHGVFGGDGRIFERGANRSFDVRTRVSSKVSARADSRRERRPGDVSDVSQIRHVPHTVAMYARSTCARNHHPIHKRVLPVGCVLFAHHLVVCVHAVCVRERVVRTDELTSCFYF